MTHSIFLDIQTKNKNFSSACKKGVEKKTLESARDKIKMKDNYTHTHTKKKELIDLEWEEEWEEEYPVGNVKRKIEYKEWRKKNDKNAAKNTERTQAHTCTNK